MKKITKEQKLFNKMMNYLVGSSLGAIVINYFVKGIVNSTYLIVTASKWIKSDSMYLSFDKNIDAFCNVISWIIFLVALPFFVKGLVLAKKYFATSK